MSEGKNGSSQINTVLLLVATGLLSWSVYNTHEQSVQMEKLRGEIQLVIQTFESRMVAAAKNRWTSAHQKIWSDELGKENPALKVPDPSLTVRQYDP